MISSSFKGLQAPRPSAMLTPAAASGSVSASANACRDQTAPMAATVLLPRILKIGAAASQELPAVLSQLQLKRPLLVTDAFMLKSGLLAPIESALNKRGFSYSIFSGCVPDPTTEVVHSGIAAWKESATVGGSLSDVLAGGSRCDCVVGIGGGSPMDTAKAIAVATDGVTDLSTLKVPATPPIGLPIIAIPTTAGTGSEVTRVSVVIDSNSSEKMLWMGMGLMPSAALVDFELTMSKPPRLTADTGLDSLCHAMEAYVSRKANPYTDCHAMEAMRTIPRYLVRAYKDGADREARERLMLAATQAGIAFSNASVTLIHGMSRPIGAHFHVPHGLSNAMLLPKVTAFSIPGAASRYAECARAMGFAASDDSDTRANMKLVEGLQLLLNELRVPTLEEYGVEKTRYFDAITLMAEQAIASGSPANNPVVPSPEQLHELYTSLWSAPGASAVG